MSSEPEIIELLGKETTLKLEGALGGQRKYITSNPSAESPIVAVIGMKTAQKLATRFGGMLLYIPQQMAAPIRTGDQACRLVRRTQAVHRSAVRIGGAHHSQDRSYIGKGKIYLKRLIASTGFLPVGNYSALEVSFEEDKKEQKDYTSVTGSSQ